MANEVSTLTLGVDSRQVKGARADLDDLAKSGKRAESATESLADSFKTLSKVVQVAAVLGIAKQAIDTADAYTTLQARLQLVSRNTMEFAQAQKAVFDISSETGNSLEQTAQLYGNLARSSRALGVSQAEVAQVTRTISQALVVSGASAQSSAAALTQLGQAFASGTLRGEELNSVLEQAPRLAQAIADGLGVSVGALRELGQTGQLTAEQVFTALRSAGDVIESEFQRMPKTVARAIEENKNTIIQFIGEIDRLLGATPRLAQFLSFLAKGTGDAASAIRTLNELGSDKGGQKLFLESQIKGLERYIKVAEKAGPLNDEQRKFLQGVQTDLAAARKEYDALFATTSQGEREQAIRNNYQTRSESYADFAKKQKDSENALIEVRQKLTGVSADYMKTLKTIQDARARGVLSEAEYVRLLTEVAKKEGEKPKRQTERSTEAERYLESLQRQIGKTQELNAVQKLQAELESGRLKISGNVTRQQLETAAKQVDAEKELVEILRLKRQAVIDAGDEVNRQNAKEREFAEKQITATQFLIDLRSRMERETSGYGKGALSREFDQGRAEIELRYAQQIAEVRKRERELKIGPSDASRELSIIQNQQAEELRIYEEGFKRKQELRQAWQLGIMEGAKTYLDEINNLTKQAEDFTKKAFNGMEDALVNFVMTGKLNFKSLVQSILADLVRIQIQQSIMSPLSGALSGLFGGLFGAAVGGGRAIGGPVSAGGIYQVNERGPEMLSVAGKQYLMMGDQSGKVTPSAGGSIVINQNLTVGDVATVSRVRAEVAAANAQLVAALRRREMTA